jgi:hypothetical protein
MSPVELTQEQIDRMLEKGETINLPCGCVLDMKGTDKARMNYSPCAWHIGLAAEAAQLEAS